jgi:hypothetical protein
MRDGRRSTLTHFIADQVRAILGDFNADDLDATIRAALDKCDQLRLDNRDNARQFAREFESVIARELGITTEETSC